MRALAAGKLEAFDAPPMLAEAVPAIRARLEEEPANRRWWVWAASLDDGTTVGAGGFVGPPEDGVAMLGYSVHEAYQGRGYATELAGLLVEWALAQPGVDLVRATVAPDNASSLRVVAKLGFAEVGRVVEPGEGELVVVERRGG